MPPFLRLVAADQPDHPLVSQPTDFRSSPFDGLIVTDWLSDVRIGDRPLFPLTPIHNTPHQPSAATDLSRPQDNHPALDALMTELAEAKPHDPALSRVCDEVDPLYRNRIFEGIALRQIGPRHLRHAQAAIEPTDKLLLTPGDISLDVLPEGYRRSGKFLDIPCYAVRFRAVQENNPRRHVPFTPDLRWQNRDLLADLRCEHSPALPSGPPPGLCDNRLRPLRFFELTLYLIPTLRPGHRSSPYTLNGIPFHLSAEGIILDDSVNNLRKTGPFALEWILPAPQPSEPPPRLPVAPAAPGSLTLQFEKEESSEQLWIPRTHPHVGIRTPNARTITSIAFELPSYAHRWTNARAIAWIDPSGSPELHLLAVPPAETTRDGTLRVSWTRWTAHQSLPPDPELALRLDPIRALSSSATGILRRTFHKGDGLYECAIGDLTPGLYALRLPDHLPDSLPEPLIVCLLNTAVRGSLTLHTRHNRCDYRQDEFIELFLTARTAEPTDKTRVEIRLADSIGRTSVVGHITLPPLDGSQRRTRFATLPAAQLQPGAYRLVPFSPDGRWIGHETRLLIHALEPPTTWEGFATRICETGPFRTPLGLCSTHMLQQSPAETLQTPEERERWIGQHRLPSSTRAACLSDPFFPPLDLTDSYTETEQALASALRFGVRYLPHGVWGMDGQTANWNPLHSYTEGLDWMRRMYGLRAQIHREFASFGGFFMNWYPGLHPHYEHHPPRAGFAEFQAAALQQAIRNAQGSLPEGWSWTKETGFTLLQPDGSTATEREILKSGPAHPLFTSAAFQSLVEWKVRGQQRRTQAFAEAYAAWTESARTLGNWNYLSFIPVGWFRSPDYYPPLYFATLPRAGIHAYTDWQVDPFQELFGIDYYGAGSGKPPWVQAFSGDRNFHIRQALLSMARGAWGVGLDAKTFVPSGRFGEEIRQLAGLLHRYGPYAMTLHPESTVAILRSFRQETADTGDFQGSGGRNGMIWFTGLQGELYALYYNLLRSGRPAAFITEEQIAAGQLSRYQALFLHRQRMPLPPEVMKQLHGFVANGGHIFKDPLTAPDYPGETVTLEPDESVQPEVGSSRHPIGQRYLWMLRNYLQCRNRLEAILARLPPPHVRSDHPHLVTASMAGRETALVVAINDTLVPPAVHTAEASWFVQGFTLARKGSLLFNRPYVVYDVTEGGTETRLSESATRQDAHWVYPVAFQHSEGRILILTDRPIRKVQIHATIYRQTLQDVLQITPSVLDESGIPFADPLPFELTLRDPHGRPLKQVYRAAGPDHPVSLTLGRNAAAGTWTLRARELVTGREAVWTFALPETPAVTLRQDQEGRLLIRRPNEMERFLQEKSAFVILLDEGQPDFFRQEAERLAQTLRTAGKQCDVQTLDPFAVHDLPLRWRRTAYDESVWRHVTNGTLLAARRGLQTVSYNDASYYDHPDSGYQQPGPRFALFRDAILMGTPANHRLIADLHEQLGIGATTDFPGPGAAIVQTVWEAFAPRFDALSIQAEDAKGLEAVRDWINTQLKQKRSPPQAREAETLIAAAKSSLSEILQPLPNVQKYGFGTPIQQIQPLDSNRLLVSLSGVTVAGPAHFLLETDSGRIAQTISDVFGSLEPVGVQRFVQRWRDRLVFRNADFQPTLQLLGPLANGIVVDPHTGHLFAAGDNLVLGLDREGRTRWVRDFRFDIRNEADFLKPLRLKIQALSEDGRALLVSGWRPRFYGRDLVGYEDPALFFIAAQNGEIVWKRNGILILNTACQLMPNGIVACHAGQLRESPRPLLFFLNEQGEPVRQIPLAQPVARIHTFKSFPIAVLEFQNDAPPQILQLDSAHIMALPVPGPVRSVWTMEEQLVVSTWDGVLHRFDPNLLPKKIVALPSSAGALLRRDDGKGWVVGTDSGQILGLTEEWTVAYETDLNRFNEMKSEASWTARWLGELPAETPEHWIELQPPDAPTLFEQVQRVADVSLLPVPFPPPGETIPLSRPPKSLALDIQQPCRPAQTILLSFRQRVRTSDPELCRWEVTTSFPNRPEPLRFQLSASRSWEERIVSFRTPEDAAWFRLTLSPQAPVDPSHARFEVERLQIGALRFRTPNLLLAQTPSVRANASEGQTPPLADPPDFRLSIPWISHLARAMGQTEQPPPIRIPWAIVADGKLEGQESSWIGKPVPQGIFCDRAEMAITFKRPKRLAAVALYHDGSAPERITRKFAVFARTGKETKLLGAETDNRNPYTLFTFEPVEAQSLLYLWAGSPDGHARLLEIEAYGPEQFSEDLLNLLP